MDTFIRQRGTRASPAPHPTLETNKHEIDARKSIFLAYFAPKGSECGYYCCSCRVVQYRRSMAERVSDSIVPANCFLLFPVTSQQQNQHKHKLPRLASKIKSWPSFHIWHWLPGFSWCNPSCFFPFFPLPLSFLSVYSLLHTYDDAFLQLSFFVL